jgi:hypothetical protein
MNDNGASDMMISRRLWLAQASGCGPGSHSATALVLEYGEQEYWLRSRFAWRRQLSAAGEPAWFASWLDTETGLVSAKHGAAAYRYRSEPTYGVSETCNAVCHRNAVESYRADIVQSVQR